jgi:hypothetical protein
LIDTVRAWPLSRKIAVGGGIAAAILLLLVVALRSPSAQEGDGLAAPGESASVAPQTAPSTPPSSAATAAESVDGAPVEVDLSDRPAVPPQPVPPQPVPPNPGRDAKGPPRALKPIPEGKARVLINGQGGSCMVTVKGHPVGSTPVSVIVAPGEVVVFCIPTKGKQLRQSVTVRAGETRSIVFPVVGPVPGVREPGF